MSPPKHHALELMRQEHETFRNTDRWMNVSEISKAKEILAQSQPAREPLIIEGKVQKEDWISPHRKEGENVYIIDEFWFYDSEKIA